MKGIMFNLLEGFVSDKYDTEAWDDILADCDLLTDEPTTIVGPGTYSDKDFAEMVQKTAEYVKVTPEELLIEFGRYVLPQLALRYPHFFTPYNHPRDFLKFTGMIHQTEVKKLYKDSETPHFSCYEIDPYHIIFKYSSKRHYASLVEGLLYGLGTYYRVPTTVCLLNCHDEGRFSVCEFDLQFSD